MGSELDGDVEVGICPCLTRNPRAERNDKHDVGVRTDCFFEEREHVGLPVARLHVRDDGVSWQKGSDDQVLPGESTALGLDETGLSVRTCGSCHPRFPRDTNLCSRLCRIFERPWHSETSKR
jgi:hypothetical protein